MSLIRLFGKEQHVHDPRDSLEADMKYFMNISEIEVEQGYIIYMSIWVYHITLLIGYATGKQTQTRTRTNGATDAPIASPYLVQTDWGMICGWYMYK